MPEEESCGTAPGPAGQVALKSLSQKGMHTFVGLIGYCLKDEKCEWFRCVCHNVTDDMMADGHEAYMRMGVPAFKKRVQLFPKNIFELTAQFYIYS